MGVLTMNGQYKDLFVGENYRNIDKKQFDNSWWYYKSFDIPEFKKEQHISLNFEGINYYANIWLNGKLIGTRDSIKGAFRHYEFDVTGLVVRITIHSQLKFSGHKPVIITLDLLTGIQDLSMKIWVSGVVYI